MDTEFTGGLGGNGGKYLVNCWEIGCELVGLVKSVFTHSGIGNGPCSHLSGPRKKLP